MSSSDCDWKESPEPASPSPAPPVSPLKRRRSSSIASTQSRKRFAPVPYNDAYRLLYNDFVQAATTNQNIHESSLSKGSQLGASTWTGSEKDAFFAALGRLGKDNLPGIAAAVRTKSILEIRYFLLLLQDALYGRTGKRGNPKSTVSLEEIPAASEISIVCERHLEAAGDTLANMQERFEATQEKKRYGEHWLLHSELADEIEAAMNASRASVPTESENDLGRKEASSESSILEEFPEAKLLIPKSFLDLSRNVFMNPSPGTNYPWPHWQELVSEQASEPSMYRTAFRDFHTLVLSLTKRIMQTAFIQATSRIRAQGWRGKKGVKLYVRSRDIHTAVDLMGLKRGRRQYWRDVPRRCRLRVTQGKHRRLHEFRWDEVEQILGSAENVTTPLDSDTDTPDPVSQAQSGEFRLRAARSGTPLPPARHSSSEKSEDSDVDAADPTDDSASDIYEEPGQSPGASSLHATGDEESIDDSPDAELEGLEAFDQGASRQEERRLWTIVGNPSAEGQLPPRTKTEPQGDPPRKVPRRKKVEEDDDWRTWTQYHADWEELRTSVPETEFMKNRKPLSPASDWGTIQNYDTDYGAETEESSRESRGKRRPVLGSKELPLRDARSYAAMQGRQSASEELGVQSDYLGDDPEIPAQSIEGKDQEVIEESAAESMEWE